MTRSMSFTLYDGNDDGKRCITGCIDVSRSSIDVTIDGYSTFDREEHGVPINLSFYNDELVMTLFHDINSQEPCMINLEQANINNRKDYYNE